MAVQIQKLCSECGEPFIAEKTSAKTCSDLHRTARNRRRKKQGEFFTEFADGHEDIEVVLQKATSAAVDRLPEAAFDALRQELAPVMREALTADVLQGIGGMVGLLPLMIQGLQESLTASKLVLDGEGRAERDEDGELLWVPDHAERAKALALGLKYTVGQPGLAPQPEAPETAPITVIFPTMPAPTQQALDTTAVELPELAEGERLCDICTTPKPAREFVGSSNRCTACHDENRVKAMAAIEKRTAPVPLPEAPDAG